MAKYSAIIAAAGKSERFGGREKKTFAKLDGKPLFIQTLQRFVNREDICQIILAMAPEDMDTMKSKYAANLAFMGVKLVGGGARRCDTVAAALKVVPDEADFVAVHDAARPCVTEAMIDGVFAEAQKSGAAILAAPVTSTLKRAGDTGFIDETVPRTGLYLAQTPQVFKKDWIVAAYAKLADGNEDITDDAQLVANAGYAVSIVESDGTNLKITAKGDILLAQAILKARPVKSVSKFGAFEEAKW
jgi:2-C-methyl-D-erythritol 4-phosphate cytidylyltransferase